MTKMITEHTRVFERKARIVCEEHFISLNPKGAFGMRHYFLYFFSLVRIRIFVRKFCVHLRSVCAPPQKLARPLQQVTFSQSEIREDKNVVKRCFVRWPL